MHASVLCDGGIYCRSALGDLVTCCSRPEEGIRLGKHSSHGLQEPNPIESHRNIAVRGELGGFDFSPTTVYQVAMSVEHSPHPVPDWGKD